QREVWHRLKTVASEEEAIEAIGDLRDLLIEEDLLLPDGKPYRHRGSKFRFLRPLSLNSVGQRHVRFGQKQTFKRLRLMSALPPKADIAERSRYVRFVPKADIMRCSKSIRASAVESSPATVVGL